MELLQNLFNLTGFPALFENPGMFIMWGIVVVFYLAIRWKFEPLLLIPIALGALLADLPSENLLEKPAGAVVGPRTGTVIATALKRGDTFKIPQVPEEISEHLPRMNRAGVKQLFQRESHRQEQGTGQSGVVIRPAGVVPTAEELIPVPWEGGMHAMGPTVSAVIGTAIVAGFFLSVFGNS